MAAGKPLTVSNILRVIAAPVAAPLRQPEALHRPATCTYRQFIDARGRRRCGSLLTVSPWGSGLSRDCCGRCPQVTVRSRLLESQVQPCQTVRMARTYWLDLFTVETWKEFLDHGSDMSGFSERRWPSVQKMKPGDYLLCYLTRVSRWVGLLEVVGEPFIDEEPIWSSQVYPSRVPVQGASGAGAASGTRRSGAGDARGSLGLS